MANRRMFSKDVVCTDAFRELPGATQNLYFQIGMEADDDGFCANVRSIMKLCRCRKKDLDLLLENSLLLQINSRLFFIPCWLKNNQLQKEKYHETMYKTEKEELKQLKPDYFVTFTSRNGTKQDKIESTNSDEKRYPKDIQKITQSSLGKVSIDSSLSYSPPSFENGKKKAALATEEDFDAFANVYPVETNVEQARPVWERLVKSRMLPSVDELQRACNVDRVKCFKANQDMPVLEAWLLEKYGG